MGHAAEAPMRMVNSRLDAYGQTGIDLQVLSAFADRNCRKEVYRLRLRAVSKVFARRGMADDKFELDNGRNMTEGRETLMSLMEEEQWDS